MPVSLLKLIVPTTDDEQDKNKNKPWRIKKSSKKAAFDKRKSSRISAKSRQRPNSKSPDVGEARAKKLTARKEQPEEKSTARKQTNTINSGRESSKSPHFAQTISSINSIEARSKGIDKTKRNSVGDAGNKDNQRLQMIGHQDSPNSPRLNKRETR